jgi:hypothetical protein
MATVLVIGVLERFGQLRVANVPFAEGHHVPFLFLLEVAVVVRARTRAGARAVGTLA